MDPAGCSGGGTRTDDQSQEGTHGHLCPEGAGLDHQNLGPDVRGQTRACDGVDHVLQDYSEELLTSHEKLKAQLIDDLGDKKVFLSLLNKYLTLLQEAHELEVAEKDPNQYAKGKRGDPVRLLRGEKIRKRVTKEKPKLENNLKKLIPERENKRGRPFMGNGSRFLEDLVIRLEQEVALKSQASGRTKSTIPSAQLVKRQQTGTHSRPASPAKWTRTGENTRGKPVVGGMPGSANLFGSETPRVVSKASSMASTRAGGKLAPQATGGSSSVVYNTRQRSQTNNHLGRCGVPNMS
ncbi:hypothetical protein PCASD_03843 [Puccinia coronata f. sp. avenae]|uniref:Uncharacterized protein n=1 Tax=Puccinia coronata f. sp. avenae TaxID=200324 RepID=A0A2N5V2M1_9BASI|nr:hypothetical protein PCASD_03843 [Puccinia coronata f. sp. avenae]